MQRMWDVTCSGLNVSIMHDMPEDIKASIALSWLIDQWESYL